MTSPVATALAAWAVFALAVFAVNFDWQTRVAGHRFVIAQAQRQAAQRPLETIENGFRPMVRAAAWQSALWSLAVLAAGTSAVMIAASRRTKDAV